jgi:hypothetical protein
VHRHRPTGFDPELAGRQGIRVSVSSNHHVGTAVLDELNFRRGCDRGHEDLCGDAQSHGGERDSGTVVTARRGDYTGARHLALKQVGEGTTRLERAGVLEQLHLEAEPDDRGETEIGRVDLHHRRAPDVRLNPSMSRDDLVARQLHVGSGCAGSLRIGRSTEDSRVRVCCRSHRSLNDTLYQIVIHWFQQAL